VAQIADEDKVVVSYGEAVVQSTRGTRLLDALLHAGIEHRHICGGHGFCTSCRVEVLGSAAGLSPVSKLERERLGPRAGDLRLACQAVLVGDTSVRVPPPVSSRFSPFDDEGIL
jgi:ferredoxin